MNKLITTLAIILSTSLGAQLDIYNDFESWTFTNSAGLEPYGAITTTLAGGTPYPNNDTTTMTSPLYNVSGDLEIEFTINGIIEGGYDFMLIQYSLGNHWVTMDSFTGDKPSRDFQLFLEAVEGTIQFRFALVADHSVNTYGKPRPNHCYLQYLYYYDITEWRLYSDNALPVVFDYMIADCETITWGTHSEFNSSHYTLEFSVDGNIWVFFEEVQAQGFTNSYTTYSVGYQYSNQKYFRLTQYDIDGSSEVLDIDDTECGYENKTIFGIYNMNGEVVDMDYEGLKIIRYTDHTVRKIY